MSLTETYPPPYGDLSDLNASRLLLDTIGKDRLNSIVQSFEKLVGNAVSVYEANGDFATAVRASNYCHLLDRASRALCDTDDNAEALACGNWLCQESSWAHASKITIETGQPFELKTCAGGITIYALPIIADGMVIGSINFGYGAPPSHPDTIAQIAQRFGLPEDRVAEAAAKHVPRPALVSDAAKQQLQLTADLIAELWLRNRSEKERQAALEAVAENETRYRRLVAYSTDATCVMTDHGRIIDVNAAVCRNLGYERDELIGMGIWEIDRQCEEATFAETWSETLGDTPILFEAIHTRKDGTTFPVEVNAMTYRVGDERFIHGTARDISERKYTQTLLRQNSERLAYAQQIVHVGDWTYDIESGDVSWSDEPLRIFGLDPARDTGTFDTLLSMIHPDDRERCQNALSEFLDKKAPYRNEYRIIRPDGAVRHIHSRAELEYRKDGTPVRLIGVVRDITEQKETEQKIIHEKEKAEQYLAIAGTIIVALDTNGMVSLINAKGCDVLGYERDEIIGKNWIDTVIPEDQRTIFQTILAHIMSGKTEAVKEYDNEVLTKSGEKRHIAWHNSIIRDEAGAIIASLSSGEDITERKVEEARQRQDQKRLEAQAKLVNLYDQPIDTILTRSLEIFSALADSPFVHAAVVDDEYRLVDMRGWIHHPDFPGQTYDMPISLSPSDGGIMAKALREKRSVIVNDCPEPLRNQTGLPAHHDPLQRYMSIPVIEGNRAVLIAVAANRPDRYDRFDAHQLSQFLEALWQYLKRLKAEYLLNAAKEEAEFANRSKSIFLANMSHELRTPLNSINGFAELMALEVFGPLPDKYQEYASLIQRSGKHLLEIINNILDMSKIEAGKIELALRKTDIRAVVESAMVLLGDQANDNGVSIRFDIADTPETMLDPLRLKQALVNIVSNAIKFSPNGAITITVKTDGDMITLCVTDTGIGMTETELEVALLPFGQVEGGAYTRRFNGTGLGLPLAKQLIELHHGTFAVKSRRGKGTTVIMRLPVTRSCADKASF